MKYDPKIANYIRMNPWRCVMDFGNGLCGMGNPSLWNLEMKNREGNLAAAEQRNRFVLEKADALWLPHVSPGGMLDRLVKEMRK